MKRIRYIAVSRSDEVSVEVGDGYGSICTGLFGELADALQEAREQLEQGYHVMLEHGEMSEEEWEPLEEVPDDFQPRPPAPPADGKHLRLVTSEGGPGPIREDSTMNIAETIQEFEQELEVLQEKCGEIEGVIESLRRLEANGGVTTTAPPTTRRAARSTSARVGRVKRRGRKKTGRAKSIEKRTNERTTRVPRVRAARSLPDAPLDGGILAALERQGASMSPADLMKATGIDRLPLRRAIKLLAKAGKVVVTGVTQSRRVSLPGQRQAKEEP